MYLRRVESAGILASRHNVLLSSNLMPSYAKLGTLQDAKSE